MKDENDDVVLDSEDNIDDSVVAEEHQGDAIKKLKEKLKNAEEKAKEYLDKWQRTQADFINIRKRDEEDKADFLKFSNAALITELLPVIDALSLAVSGGDKGVGQTFALLMKTLKKHGLEELNPTGEVFNPGLHEAVATVQAEKKDEDNKVLEVLQKGYIISGKCIRPAKVKVGEFTSPDA
jgi:molecular chaperone GrpE